MVYQSEDSSFAVLVIDMDASAILFTERIS
jgi:phosphatidylethanolamine-binding protein (PEBP) family uncharacterized protein